MALDTNTVNQSQRKPLVKPRRVQPKTNIKLDVKKFFTWPAMKNMLFSLPKNTKKYDLWSSQKVTDALIYFWTIFILDMALSFIEKLGIQWELIVPPCC